jgi:metal-responsive CopG/Arc/MetJ family transcriptional regulator
MALITLDRLVQERREQRRREEAVRQAREAWLAHIDSRWRIVREENGGLTVVFSPGPAGR